jgi:predicted phage terminase large subunit-like protein
VRRVNPHYRFYRHTEVLITALQRVADGEIGRLMIFLPPRHSKSETVSRLFAAYFVHRHPRRFVGLASYGADLAYTLSRQAREYYRLAGGLFQVEGVEQWETDAGGGMWAAGVGGPATGKGYHLGIVDDPLKNAEDAASVTIREKQKEWWRSTFYTRQEPEAAIIVLLTRWNEDDLAGWLLAEEEAGDDEPERWHVISMPAIYGEGEAPVFPETCTVEPDWRAAGEALCPERYPVEKLRKYERRLGSYFWEALFQQSPKPRSGAMFQREWFPIVEAAPRAAQRVRYWDKAGTQGGGKATAGVLMAVDADGVFYVEHVVRGQYSALERERVIRQTAEADAAQYGDVEIWMEQEPGSGGKESAEGTVRSLAGFRVHKETVSGDKVTRAEPFAAQCEARNVRLVRGAWNGGFLDELTAFPYGKFKDQADAGAGAFNKLAGSPKKIARVR